MDCLLEVKSAQILGTEFLDYNIMLCKMTFKFCSTYTHRHSNLGAVDRTWSCTIVLSFNKS